MGLPAQVTRQHLRHRLRGRMRKLGTYNRRSLLYRAFREVGRVEHTLFLLRFFSTIEIRRVLRAETTKIEAYNDFLD